MTSNSRQQPGVTVAICTRNRASQLATCLEHVLRLDYPRFEILVVDNGSADTTPEVARRFGVRCIKSTIPGLSRARNDAARNCQTEIIAYIDDDGIPAHDWLTEISSAFSDPRVLAVAGRIEIIDKEPSIKSGEPRKVDRSTPDWFSITNFGGVGDGGNMAFRMSVFSCWRGFDERLGLGTAIGSGEEHRAFYDLVAMGGRCVSTPHAVVRHRDTWTERHMQNVETAIAYSLLLFREEPSSRALWMKHAFKHLFSRRRGWREHRAIPEQPPLTWSEAMEAVLVGFRLYAQTARVGRAEVPLLRDTPISTAT